MSDQQTEILEHLRRIEERLTGAEAALQAIRTEMRALAERPSRSTVTFMGGMGTTSMHDTREQ